MESILGIPKYACQGIPNNLAVRLAYMDTWHKRLQFAREEAGLRPTDVATKIKVSNATVSDWESGETKKIEGDNLLNVCELLNISPRWLLYKKGGMRDGLYSEPIQRGVMILEQLQEEYRLDDALELLTSVAKLARKQGNEKQ